MYITMISLAVTPKRRCLCPKSLPRKIQVVRLSVVPLMFDEIFSLLSDNKYVTCIWKNCQENILV